MTYPRDLIGYGQNPPDPKWPGGARLALNFVMNYEEGSEYSIPDGDGASEVHLGESVSTVPAGMRDLAIESTFEFGSRVGFWRLMRLFAERRLPMTVFACALALERHPEATTSAPTDTAGGSIGCSPKSRSANPSATPWPRSQRRRASGLLAGIAATARA
jgi:peptidoglycan/xylan/chitin deacetylase (PgdA/CDA1 family)